MPIIHHPFIFSLYPILALFSYNMGKIPLSAVYFPMLVTLYFVFILFYFLSFILKNKQKAGLLTSFIVFYFFSYQHIYQIIYFFMFTFDLKKSLFVSRTIFAIFTTLIFAGFIFLFVKKQKFDGATKLLNKAAIVLVLIVLLNIGVYEIKAGNFGKAKWQSKKISDDRALSKNEQLPNIYYIILDGYANREILKDIYKYDNSDFLDFLKEKGFYVVNNSYSNYSQTFLSLASSLNFVYLDNVSNFINTNSRDHRPLMPMIKNNLVFQHLRQKGYDIVAFSSGSYETEIKKADIYLSSGQNMDEFQNLLISMTPIPGILDLIKTDDLFDLHYKRVLFILENLAETKKIKPPVFVFAHVMIPHPPFVFNKNGEKADVNYRFTEDDGNWLIRKGRLTEEEYINGYKNQVEFVNSKIKVILNELLEADEKPVIILQADHGPRSKLVWENPEKTYFKECMSILNAYYLPEKEETGLYSKITPVNTFRILFNNYFGTNYEVFEDKIYFSTAKNPYKFIDVTEKIRRDSKDD